MKQRPRIYYTESQKALMWERWRKGELRVKFRVGSMRPTKRPGWGIVALPSELVNQRDEVVQKGEHRLMIPRRPEAAAG